MSENRKTLLIESQYFGSIHYFARILYHGKVMIEQHEHYIKSTFRNRCIIASPQGALRLSVPLLKGKHQKKAFKDIEIAYHHPWQKQHWNSLCSAYRSTPYFEYYEDDIEPLFRDKQTRFLMEFNMECMQFVLSALSINIDFSFTDGFEKDYTESTNLLDFRSLIHPKKEATNVDSIYVRPQYYQVFEKKTGFLPNLSILDLLFAEGPNTTAILESCMNKKED